MPGTYPVDERCSEVTFQFWDIFLVNGLLCVNVYFNKKNSWSEENPKLVATEFKVIEILCVLF